MKSYFVRERTFALLSATSLVLLAACEDKRVAALDTGMTRDAVVSALATQIKPGSGSDSFPNVYSRDRYLIGGKNIEVLYFTPNNEKAGKDTVPMKRLTPLVFMDNRMIAKGWKQWDSISEVNHIPLKKR